MAYVKVFYKDNSDEGRLAAVESAIKSFKRKVEKEGIIKDVKKREEYNPPSVIKRIKHKEAVKRNRKAESKRRRFNKDWK